MFGFFSRKTRPTGKVSILIPTIFDSRYIIELCIKSILKYTEYPDYQIMVGDAGIDDTTREYLLQLQTEDTIKIIKIMDSERPKDELVCNVETEYYMLLHDDVRIMKSNWLETRLDLINRNRNNAIVGTTVKNSWNSHGKRFFPLGMLVRTEASRQMNLIWGKKRPDFDTGFLAYKTFCEQDKYKFVKYKISKDIYHFAEMGWPQCSHNKNHSKLDVKLQERERKVLAIRDMLDRNDF